MTTKLPQMSILTIRAMAGDERAAGQILDRVGRDRAEDLRQQAAHMESVAIAAGMKANELRFEADVVAARAREEDEGAEMEGDRFE